MRLNVPYVKQFNASACFPACVSMVMKYYGDNINQKSIYYKSRFLDPSTNRPLGCWDATIILAIKDKPYLMESWINYNKNAKLPKPIKNLFNTYKLKLKEAQKLNLLKVHKNADTILIKNFINKGIPVIVEVYSRTWFNDKKADPEETHTVVIFGYEDNEFVLHDPAMHYYKKKGKGIRISIDHFMKAWVDYPYYKNSLSVLVPKNPIDCVIIHGCPSDAKDKTYNKHWIPWLKKELTIRGIKTETPLMPEPWQPNYSKFKKKFDKYKINGNTILIGHSCGCAFLVRWLGETKHRVKKLILVAPWKVPDGSDKYRKAFYEYQIDKTIKSRVKQITMFTADDEEKNGKKSLDIYHKALDGKVIELKKHGHYTIGDMRTEKFPELLKEITE